MSYVYLLLATPNRNATYVGATVDLERRLRQHNKEIKGGAVATSTRVIKGDTWIRAAYVQGFPDWFDFCTPIGKSLSRTNLTKWVGDAVPSVLGAAAVIAALA